ncbi:MAG: beta-ketoacyl-ACP synthase II [Clostridiales bacterium]|nr:beta-ketoacyl-ACP synthase II [Clostridiales bacterium]
MNSLPRRVVVTGLGIISPIGLDIPSYEEGLFGGVCGVGLISKFDTADFKVKIAAEVKGFQPELYLEKSEIKRTDLYAQYALAAAGQAMEDSALAGSIEPERLGVYVGSGVGGMLTSLQENRKFFQSGPRKVSPFYVPMMIANMASGLIAIKYQAKGCTLPVVTACATSSNALGEAYRNIREGYSDAIIAGGAEATINPMAMAGFTNCLALTTCNEPESASIPFDRRRDGFVMGEGGAILILEEYSRARGRGARIYAEIMGYANTCDAYHMTAPAPDGSSMIRCMKLAMAEAGVTSASRIYVNAHGTGTPLNDKAETLVIKEACREQSDHLLVSSSKSMIGHMLGAAGAAEAIACILALKRDEVPPTIGYKEPDPECDLDIVPNQKRTFTADFALSNSMGFGGHNACLAFAEVRG